MLRRAVMLATAMALAVAAPAMAHDRKAELRQLVFEVCPKVLAGTVSLADPTQVAALGFAPTAPRDTPGGKLPRAEKGTGTDRIVLSSGPATCSIWFGGPENPTLAGSLVEEAFKAKFSGGGMPARLGDGTLVFIFNRKAEPSQTLSIFLADAGGELDFRPATTVVMISDKGK